MLCLAEYHHVNAIRFAHNVCIDIVSLKRDGAQTNNAEQRRSLSGRDVSSHSPRNSPASSGMPCSRACS